MRILIVEDEERLAKSLKKALEKEGFAADYVTNGETGLSRIEICHKDYDLVILDLMLPKKDGLQILRDLKVSPPREVNGPIVVLTNLGQEVIIKQSFALGASGYLIKSAMNPDQVLQEIRSYLGKDDKSSI